MQCFFFSSQVCSNPCTMLEWPFKFFASTLIQEHLFGCVFHYHMNKHITAWKITVHITCTDSNHKKKTAYISVGQKNVNGILQWNKSVWLPIKFKTLTSLHQYCTNLSSICYTRRPLCMISKLHLLIYVWAARCTWMVDKVHAVW